MTKDKSKKKPIHCGSFGYISRKKRTYRVKLGIEVMVALTIFIVGYYLNKKSSANIWSVFAMLMVLPAAKAIVAIVVFYPYKTVSRTRYQNVFDAVITHLPKELVSEVNQVMMDTIVVNNQLNLYTDMVFTSPEKVMNLDFLVIEEHRMIGLLGKKTQNANNIEAYLQSTIIKRGLSYKVKIVTEERQFLSALKSIQLHPVVKENPCKARKELLDCVNSLIVR